MFYLESFEDNEILKNSMMNSYFSLRFNNHIFTMLLYFLYTNMFFYWNIGNCRYDDFFSLETSTFNFEKKILLLI